MDHHIPDLDDHDESVRIAVNALGDMLNGAARSDGAHLTIIFLSCQFDPQMIIASRSLSSSSSSKSISSSTLLTMSSSQAFSHITENTNVTLAPPSGLVSRMSHIPLVECAIWAYEQGKALSRVVKVCNSFYISLVY